jgi:hypothetical protein
MDERRRQVQTGNGEVWWRRFGTAGAGTAALVAALVLALAAGPAAAAVAAVGALPAPGTPGAAPAAGAAGAARAQYALIVNGDDSFTHNYNVQLALRSLWQMGFEPRNTLVLAPPEAVTVAADDGAGSPGTAGAAPWHQAATEQGLQRALGELHGRMRAGDRLLVYLTGHGYRMFGRASLGLQHGSVTARELIEQLGQLPFGELVLVADQCYSGAFVDAAIALGRDVVAVSSTDDRHEVRCEPFVRPLWLAAAEAANGSVEEAFQTAASGLRRAGGGIAPEAPPRYAASGSCAGRRVPFSSAGPVTRAAVGGPASQPAAPGATAAGQRR